ncbi:MAG: NAD(P)H-dependent glycerol-3-phosphate dehydrogenase [Balneolaceae bacterium]
MNKITIIGAGSFGTALSIVLAKSGYPVSLWAREEEVIESINKEHFNSSYLTDIKLPDTVRASADFEEALDGAVMVVVATPSHTVREVVGRLKQFLRGDEVIVTVAKGIENDTFMTMSQVLVEVLDGIILEDRIGVLYGPSHAEEVGLFKPTTVVSAAYSKSTARFIQETFMTPMFRVYLNNDIMGVEIGGSVKNVMAIAAGIVDGAELGDNAKAALMTRGLHEMKRMGMQLGASQDTFSGLTGMGDLIVTCTSEHSRNRHVGYRIGQGAKLDEIISGMNMVAEGVKTARSVHQWAERNRVEMPITEAVHKVLFDEVEPRDALYELMTRNAKEEILI